MNNAKPLRVLCLDMETGFGGSSRSLWHSLQHMDKKAVQPEVWRLCASAYDEMYRNMGIACRVMPDIPKGKPVANTMANVLVFARAFRDLMRARGSMDAWAADIQERFDVVHFNLDSTFLFAHALRKRLTIPFVLHARTTTFFNLFFRWQARMLSKTMDYFVFITENEERDFHALGGRGPGRVIYNISALPPDDIAPHESIVQDKTFRVACLSNYAHARGVDRLVTIAENLRAAGRKDVRFVVAGNMKLHGTLPGELGRIAREGGSLEDYAKARGVDDWFLFLGHVTNPEAVLAGCHALIKPTRMNNPWGRDIIEALSFGCPVFSVGSYDRFVESGVTGVLLPEFDPQVMAQEIVRIADAPDLLARLGQAARERVATLCSGPTQAAELLQVWQRVSR